MMKNIFEAFMSMIFPRLCVMCMRESPNKGQNFCVTCLFNMPTTNHFDKKDNAAAMKFWGRFSFEHAGSLLNFYGYTDIRWMMHRLKYQGRKDIGIILGAMAGKWVNRSDLYTDIDLIVPVPLHRLKKMQRGYNQAAKIGMGLSDEIKIPLRDNVIRKKSFTKSQTRMGRIERVKNVFSSFELIDKNGIQGRHILIVDDVLTTGATIEACALKLLESKGVRISILTVCIARH